MFRPVNRYLLVEKVADEPKEESCVLVPEEYRLAKKSLHGVYTVLNSASDCEKVLDSTGHKVIVDESMVQEIALMGETHYLVLENYVYGVI